MRALAADRSHRFTFFCGGSRNFHQFLDVFDGVSVLTMDADTLAERLAARSGDEFGALPEERDPVLRLHLSGEDTPSGGLALDATAPLDWVVGEILERAEAIHHREEVPGRRRSARGSARSELTGLQDPA